MSTAPAQAGGGGEATRERILDVALALFNEKGYEKTSVREIAERLGITKPAIYYYFSGKDDILMSLHLRLHELGRRAMDRLGQLPPGVGSWARLLDELIEQMLGNDSLFAMHERNRAAFEALHRKEHDAEHEDLEQRLRQLVADPSLPLRERIRLGCTIGAMMTSLVLFGEIEDVPLETRRELLREIVHDLLGPRPERRGPSGRACRASS